MRLLHAPLVHVLAEVRFSPVLGLKERIPPIQQAFSSAGFPWFGEGVSNDVIQVVGAAPQIVTRQFWIFQSRDKSEAATLSERSLTLHTGAYSTKEPFLEGFRGLVEVLGRECDVQLTARVGLRYVDRIAVKPDLELDRYVQAGLLGFPYELMGDGSPRRTGFRQESVAETENGTLVIRSMLVPPGQAVPPDLGALPLQYPTLADLEFPGLILDFDHFSSLDKSPFPFEASSIYDEVERLHGVQRLAFETASTPFAIEQWGPWVDA